MSLLRAHLYEDMKIINKLSIWTKMLMNFLWCRKVCKRACMGMEHQQVVQVWADAPQIWTPCQVFSADSQVSIYRIFLSKIYHAECIIDILAKGRACLYTVIYSSRAKSRPIKMRSQIPSIIYGIFCNGPSRLRHLNERCHAFFNVWYKQRSSQSLRLSKEKNFLWTKIIALMEPNL